MIVFNTTFHVDEVIQDDFIEYMLQVFIPMSTKSGLLTYPRLSRIFGKDEDEGISFAMEFQVADIVVMEKWNADESKYVFNPLMERFKEKMIGFSTLMQTIDY
ncbi:MAG: DUF4286 family protein [Fermentimonas sp.]|nr:DUF4286 family protein [Fermentimonas sp.]